jgi:L-fuconolactonase
MNIDAHQHFWIYDPGEYPWISDKMSVLRRDFLPADLEQAHGGLCGSIAVQARQSLAETRWLLNLAEKNSSIRGVVGWVDLRAENVAGQLAEFADHPRFVGVRHVVQDEPDVSFMLDPKFLRGLGQLKQFGLTYDFLVYPKQLPACIEVARKFPDQPFVLDHMAKPLIRAGVMASWPAQIRALADCPNVYCKISGLVTEAKWNDWKETDFLPFLEIVWDAFGEDRLMIGSDWPVCLVAGEYQRVMNIAVRFCESKSPAALKKIRGLNAAKFYGIDRKSKGF